MPETKCGFDGIPGGATGADFLAAYGPTLKVHIGFDPHWRPNTTIIPTSGIQDMDALVDTGASECCIDNFLASQLNLPIVDRRSIAGVGGKHETNMYLAQVHVPALGFTMHGVFAGVALHDGGQLHRALIGRTFLRHFTMNYYGKTGRVILTS